MIFTQVTLAESKGYCDEAKNSTYRDIYCDIGWSGNEDKEKELYKIVMEKMAYGDLGYEFIQVILESGKCSDITTCITEKGIEFAKLPIDLQDLVIACDESFDLINSNNAWKKVKDKVKTAYNNAKVTEQTKTKLEYEFKASEKFWDGKVFEVERASFDLIVDLNLIDIVLFGSRATWVDDVFAFPNRDEDEGGNDNANNTGGTGNNQTDNQTSDEQPTTDTEDSVTGEQTDNEGITVECVSPDDPNADLGDTPGTPPNPNCGNGTLDVLFGEQCDDGNNISGDGCSQYCLLEENGGSLDGEAGICIDEEAVTFLSPSESGSTSGGVVIGTGDDTNGNTTSVCPPGTVPSKNISITGPALTGPSDGSGVAQSPNYPGPFIGGTLKQFPPSNRPRCPFGYSELTTMGAASNSTSSASGTASGSQTFGINVAGKQYDIPVCIPTELCASFDDIRSVVFGDDWKEDEERSKAAYAIEALFCVNLTTNNRPESPYAQDEGCIDCHIRAIVDSLSEALDTNVAPMKNTTAGFAISASGGPNLSLNLSTAVQQKLKLASRDTRSGIQKIEEYIDGVKAKEAKEPAMTSFESAQDKAQYALSKQKKDNEAMIEAMKSYRDTNNSINDQGMFTSIKPLLIQMLQSFQGMQANYDQLTRDGAAISLAGRNVCK